MVARVATVRRGAAVLILTGALAACASPSGTPAQSPVQSGPAATSGEMPVSGIADCQPLDLLLPSGEPLDLTGSWEGNDLGPYQMRQFGDCLWWIGQSATYSMLFFGRVNSDFTVAGPWSTVAASDHVIGGVRNDADLYIGVGSSRCRSRSGTAGRTPTSP